MERGLGLTEIIMILTYRGVKYVRRQPVWMPTRVAV